MNWLEIAKKPAYEKKPEHEKRLIREDFFNTFVKTDPQFPALFSDTERERLEQDFVYQGLPTIGAAEEQPAGMLAKVFGRDELSPADRAQAVIELTPETVPEATALAEQRPPGAFDPEGAGYDYASAVQYGITPDQSGHWPSRIPQTGLLLKGRKHKTWPELEAAEAAEGMAIVKKDGRYYSRPKFTPGRAAGVLKEGTKDVARSTLMALLGLGAATQAVMGEKTPAPEIPRPWALPGDMTDYPLAGDKMEGYRKAIEALKPAEAFQGPSSGFIEDVLRTAPQVGSQITATLLAGPAGGMGLMAAQIAGSTYENLTQSGVASDRAIAAGLANAILQTPLEQFGIGKIMKAWKPQKALIGKLKDIVQAMGTEGFTEWIQAYPDLIANVFALNPDAALLDKGKKIVDELWTTTKQGAYEGAVGATLGGAAATIIGAAAQTQLQKLKIEAEKKAKAPPVEEEIPPEAAPPGREEAEEPPPKRARKAPPQHPGGLHPVIQLREKRILQEFEQTEHPAVAEEGKGFFVRWGDGRVQTGFKKKADAVAFAKAPDRALIWITYRNKKDDEVLQEKLPAPAGKKELLEEAAPPEPAPQKEWKDLKVGDVIYDDVNKKNIRILGKKIRPKYKAQALAEENNGEVWSDTKNTWAVIRYEETTAKKEAAPKTKPAFEDLVREAHRWKGAATKADALYPAEDKQGRLQHSRMTTKGDLDAYLMKTFGIDEATARDVSNELTDKNLKPDMSAEVSAFKGEPWADAALKAKKQAPGPPPKAKPEAPPKAREVPTLLLKTHDGTIYEGRAETHADLLEREGLSADEIADTGAVFDGRKVWSGGPAIKEKPPKKVVWRGRPVVGQKQADAAKTFRAWVRAKGGLNQLDPGWRGEIADISRGARWQPGVLKKKGMTMDELVAQANEDGWDIADGNDALDALTSDRARPTIAGSESDIDQLYQDAIERLRNEGISEEDLEAAHRIAEDEAQDEIQEETPTATAEEIGQWFAQQREALEKERPPQTSPPTEEPFELTGEKGTAYERMAEVEREGLVTRPAKGQRKAAVFPEEGIKPGTGGKQKGLFGEDEPQGDLFSGTGKYDTGGYAAGIKYVLELPEIVRLAKALLKGKYPMVRQKLRVHKAAGTFYPVGDGRIELKADIFENPEQAAAVLAHEVGHLVDWLPDRDLKRGNILGHIATLNKYLKHTLPERPGAPGELTDKDRRRLRALARKMMKGTRFIDEEITKELPITPEDVLNIWNAVEQAKAINPELYEFVAGLNTAEKKSIVKDALKGQVAADLKRFAKKITEKIGRQIEVPATPEDVSAKYRELINAEIKKRRLFQKDEIMDELKSLTRAWKPFDPAADHRYTAYRYHPVELYADAFSALLNAPGLLKSKAPLFYEAFFNYMERKPEARALYETIQDELAAGTQDAQLVKETRAMLRDNDRLYAKSLTQDIPWRDALARDFIDANWFVLKKLRKVGEKNVHAGENPRYKLEEMTYAGSEAEWLMLNVFRDVIKPLENTHLDWVDLGEFLLHDRVIYERGKKANPKGWFPKRSKKRLADWMETLPDTQRQALKNARSEFQRIHNYMITQAEAADIFTPELIKVMKKNEHYATFDVAQFMHDRYGRGIGPRIYKQVGTFQEITNPATATLMKDISIVKAVNRSMAAKSVVKFLKQYFPDEIRPADRRFNGRYMEIMPPEKGGEDGMIVYLDKGRAQGYYVQKEIAEIFEENPISGNIISRLLRTTIQPFRMAFTELNYGFWMFNIHRDYFRAAAALPKNKVTTFFPYYMKGIRPAFKSVFGKKDAVVEEMLKGNMLISIADVRGLRSEDKQIERMLKQFHFRPATFNRRILRPFGQMFNYFTNIGRGFERTTKVASYLYLKERFPGMPLEQIGHLVRTRGGSPDFLRLGWAFPFYNNLLMFSNAMKEGYRGDYEAFADTPGEFMWKKAKYVYMPKLLMYAGAIGALGLATKAIFDGASEYDKTNYLIIPLDMTESGKSVYLRVPQDETSRLMGGIFWKLLNHEKLGWRELGTGLLDYMAGQAPTAHPGIEMLYAIITYACGGNPYDWFHGRHAIPEQVFEAGDTRSHEAMLKYLANKAGAGIVYRFQYDDVARIKTELEKVTGYPFASNIVGRFIKVSNYGVKEDLDREIQRVRQTNAGALLDAKDALSKIVREEPLSAEDVAALLNKPDIIDRNLAVAMARKYGMVYLEAFLKASSQEEQAAVLRIMLEKAAAGIEYKPEGVNP